jgi:hypothetical protein
VALLMVMLWVRSYSWLDGVLAFRTVSLQGNVVIGDTIELRFKSIVRANVVPIQRFGVTSISQNAIVATPAGLGQNVPYWVLVTTMAVLAPLPWLPIYRFSLRTLLIATTAVAVVLGLIVYLLR